MKREDDFEVDLNGGEEEDTAELPEVPLAVYRAIFPPGSPLTRVELTPDRERSRALHEAVELANALRIPLVILAVAERLV